MRKLFDLRECGEEEPMDPGPGSSSEDWYDYFKDWSAWLTTCMRDAPILTPEPPEPPDNPPPFPPPSNDNRFEDAKGYVWVKTVSAKGIDFKLDFFDISTKLTSFSVSDSDNMIIGVRISIAEYSILTLGPEGIKMETIKRNKVRWATLLKMMNNHTKLPNTDLNKISAEFWGKQSHVHQN